ncbi:MAG: LptF/LptG family permease [Candidatus Neomarinimicrobiota bacterium]|nr:MAG: YjgP/YjgQ family permease [bacterium]|tara:strand:+ start:378 stop:1757 length:1380 start_codon:yes stop_codon:yes gene_type:complete
MLLISRYIIKELILPFIYSLMIIVLMLFINFFLRAIDRFLGKGLSVVTIFEYLFLNLAWIVALAVPMAVLIATLMAFGRMSEDNEINAMRASGISFTSILKPALIFGVIICLTLTYFNNYILPEMNFYARLLQGDIHKKRPGLEIEPGHFINSIPDYSMIIRKDNNGMMEDVRIFSKENQEIQTSIYSLTGELEMLDDAIVLMLYDGEIHELDLNNYKSYRRINFKQHKIIIPADDMMLARRDTSNRSDREMTVPMMLNKKANYNKRSERVQTRIGRAFNKVIGDSIVPVSMDDALLQMGNYRTEMLNKDITPVEQRRQERKLKSLERQMNNEYRLIQNYQKSQNKYAVEIHKKFSLPIACILFVLVGAPLGTLTRKGGFMVAISMGFGFFLIYYIFLIGGEELADRNRVSPFIGMWAPNFLLLIAGIYLTLNTVRDRASIQFNWPWKKKSMENNNDSK